MVNANDDQIDEVRRVLREQAREGSRLTPKDIEVIHKLQKESERIESEESKGLDRFRDSLERRFEDQ